LCFEYLVSIESRPIIMCIFNICFFTSKWTKIQPKFKEIFVLYGEDAVNKQTVPKVVC